MRGKNQLEGERMEGGREGGGIDWREPELWAKRGRRMHLVSYSDLPDIGPPSRGYSVFMVSSGNPGHTDSGKHRRDSAVAVAGGQSLSSRLPSLLSPLCLLSLPSLYPLPSVQSDPIFPLPPSVLILISLTTSPTEHHPLPRLLTLTMESRTTTAEPSNKRPRSPSDYPQIASKAPKSHSNHLQINYLARQYSDNLPLVSLEDTMPAIMHLIGEYDGVLHRHESIAGNLGACPLGPILVKRFERLFEGPPRVLKSNGKDAPNITWLDVVEFAKSKPEQFNLEKSRNGVRVCQFYTKQCRVEISEEDFVVIASGMPQKMIPPQPIIEDEEKELGALEILEKNLQQIIQVADQGGLCAFMSWYGANGYT